VLASILASSTIAKTASFLLVCRRVVAHRRAIILLLILALATFLIAHADFFGLSLFALLLIFIASQFFWIGRILDLGSGSSRVSPAGPASRSWRAWSICSSSCTKFVVRIGRVRARVALR